MFLTSAPHLFSADQDSTGREIVRLGREYDKYRDKGDFVNAERTVKLFFQYPLTEYLKGNAYTRLAFIYVSLGRFDEAMSYLKRIEKLDLTETEKAYLLPYEYILETIIFEKKRSYYQAIEFTEKSIRIYESALHRDEKYFLESLTSAYHNMGAYHNEIGQYDKALKYLAICMKMRNDHGFLDKGSTFSAMARSYVGLKEFNLAESYFKRSIETSIKEYGLDYYKLPEFYFNYGEFLQNSGRMSEAADLFRSGLGRCLEIYGEKNIQTSRAYDFLANYHLLSGNIDSALYYYQRSLISIVPDFNEPDITKNPAIDASILDTRLMENLKGKSLALEALAARQEGDTKMQSLNLSLETIVRALDLIDVIRENYPSEEIMIYITGTEKETYMSALRIASEIYATDHNESFMQRMYDIAIRAKAAVLRNQIAENNLLYSSALPASLREEHQRFSANIAGYSKLILEESGNKDPDTAKINMWKDELFEMKNAREKLTDSISRYFPQYAELLRKTFPVSAAAVQSKLGKDEIIIDYFISKKYSEGKRKLYMFLVSRNDINLIEREVDSLFEKSAGLICKNIDPFARDDNNTAFISALHYFYRQLIKPAEDFLEHKRIIIISDEEINCLPFEAFIRELPERNQNDFDGLHFLINDYIFSHAYSASLLPERSEITSRPVVYSFSPSYGVESGYDSLGGAIREIRNISSLMKGKQFTFGEATKTSFLNALNDPVLFHLAMHSISDSVNSLYSYLLFDGVNDEDARLYNYEVSLNKINSPLIVLSSCNSGAGNLFSGEGQMSLARSFMLAGALSVVRTAWKVNDDAGSEIITRFYYYLSKGENKDEALQLAKLDFINGSTPAFRDPYYWASYEILGDNGPVTTNNRIVTLVTVLLLPFMAGIYFYFRRRRIFSDGSR